MPRRCRAAAARASRWFAAPRRGVVGYVTHSGVRIVAGAPVCEGGRLLAAASEFEAAAFAAGTGSAILARGRGKAR